MKMEKADILERAVEHLRLLQDTYACRGKSSPMSLVSDQHLMKKKYKLVAVECNRFGQGLLLC